MEGYTRLEQHFLQEVRQALVAPATSFQLLAKVGSRKDPELILTARVGDRTQAVRVLIHGVRPVRYHFSTANTEIGRKVKSFLSRLLGSDNLVKAKLEGELALTYHVSYPEKVTKKLGG